MARLIYVLSLQETILEERTMREDALVRERRVAEEEIQKALQSARRMREDETRKIQERILEVNGAINEERDMRNEALRQERQKLTDTKDTDGETTPDWAGLIDRVPILFLGQDTERPGRQMLWFLGP